MEKVYCFCSSVPDSELFRLDNILSSDDSCLVGYSYCVHENHVHVFLRYCTDLLEDYISWKKYVAKNGKYKVIEKYKED